MKTLGIILLSILGLAVLVMAAVGIICVISVGSISKEEDERARRQMEDDRVTCGPIEED